ncbi:MAG: DUF4358 domain-containing protein, partial [Clostridium sp.]|nr:DUF4358 domain-containing protein [Clostridium sp.]
MSFHSYQTNLTPSELATIVMDAQEDLVPLTMIASPSDEWVDYVTTRYGIDTQEIVDGVVCYPFGVNASEIAILRYQNEEAAQNGVSQLEQYAQLRAAAFAGYAPEEAALLEQAIAIAYGDYAALFICPDPQSAIETFKDCFKKSSTPAADSGGSMTSPGFASSQGFPSSSDSTSPQDTTSPPVPTSAQDSTSSQDPT